MKVVHAKVYFFFMQPDERTKNERLKISCDSLICSKWLVKIKLKMDKADVLKNVP